MCIFQLRVWLLWLLSTCDIEIEALSSSSLQPFPDQQNRFLKVLEVEKHNEIKHFILYLLLSVVQFLMNFNGQKEKHQLHQLPIHILLEHKDNIKITILKNWIEWHYLQSHAVQKYALLCQTSRDLNRFQFLLSCTHLKI